MKLGSNLLTRHNADLGRELGVERGNPVEGIHREAVGCFEVGHLSEGMNPGIGTTGTVEPDWLASNLSKGGLEPFLNGVSIWLDLPSGKGGSVVGDGDFEVHA